MRALDSYFTLQKLEVFCTVVELQSVTRAADRLCVSQPVISAHLRTMEEKLGVKLVKRSGRNIALTEHGERVYTWASDVMTRTREMERELSSTHGDVKGHAVIAASMSVGSYVLPGMVSDFQLIYPNSVIQIQISNPTLAMESVLSGKSDYGVMILAPGQNLTGLKVFPLWKEPLVLTCAPNSKWLGNQATAEDLRNVPFVGASRALLMRELEDREMRANGIINRRVVLEMGHPEAQKIPVKRDLAVCFFLASSVHDDVARNELRVVETPGMSLSISLHFVQRAGKEFSVFQNELAHFIRNSKPEGLQDLIVEGEALTK
jgi:DNA-binding transcriptional LysR family regulator